MKLFDAFVAIFCNKVRVQGTVSAEVKLANGTCQKLLSLDGETPPGQVNSEQAEGENRRHSLRSVAWSEASPSTNRAILSAFYWAVILKGFGAPKLVLRFGAFTC